MNKVMPIISVLLFASLCLGMTLLMPWAELGFPAPLPQLEQLRHDIAASLPGANDPQVFAYYVYSLFLGLALLSAAVGICMQGRDESEEVTVLPLKK